MYRMRPCPMSTTLSKENSTSLLAVECNGERVGSAGVE